MTPLTGAERQKRYRERHPEYRDRELARMRKNRSDPVFAHREYIRERERDLTAERERVLAALEDNRREQECLTNS